MPTPLASAMSREEIESLARRIRAKFKCTDLYFDIIRFVEYVLPSIDSSFCYEYVDSAYLPANTYAFYDPHDNIMRISSDVYENAIKDIGRDRFTIAHEVGHYFLHRNNIALARSKSSVPAYRNPEWQANVFASALLIPVDKTKFMTPEEIQVSCKVSYQAACIASRRNWQ